MARWLGCSWAIVVLGAGLVGCPSAPAPAPEEDGPEEALAAQGEPCDEASCADDFVCVEYVGIAGPAGPKLTSCEIPCVDDTPCPDGQACVTIADGPGQVCRPKP